MAVDDELLDRLANAPFGDWVSERDAVAKELRGEGRREEADEVKQLRKPSAPVWAANQLARRRPRCIQRLVEAAERLRTAQASRREDFATARAEERDALEAAVAEGRSILAEAGAESEAMASRLEKTLRSAAATEATADVLRAGRLAEELEAAGFDALLGAFSAATPAAKPKKSTPRRRQAELQAARKRVEAAREAATGARKNAREAERRADAARRDAERAQEEAHAASAAAADADSELEAARASLSELRQT
jgi:hypothetical protein